jgi:aspartate oxidase
VFEVHVDLADGAPAVDRAPSPCLTRPSTIHARAVVIATGGWCGKYAFSDNPPELRGDGIALAQSLGAAVRDLDAVQYEPTVALAPARLRGIPVITTMLHEGATFRNRLGDEFLPDRHANKDEISRAIRAEIEAGRGIDGGVWYDATGVSREILETRYMDTVRRYAACGIDITREPMLVAPAPHTSLGGVVIDACCRVQRSDGMPIPGLFAAGEVTGGVHGRNRLGGNAGTEVLVFGRIAGESAAQHGNRPQ